MLFGCVFPSILHLALQHKNGSLHTFAHWCIFQRSIWKCAQNVNRHCNWYAEHTSFGESMFSQQRRIYLISIFLPQQQRKSTKKKQSGMMNLSYHDVQHFVSSLLSIVAISHVSAFRISIDTHAFWSLCQAYASVRISDCCSKDDGWEP